jgi:hypothetical protein
MIPPPPKALIQFFKYTCDTGETFFFPKREGLLKKAENSPYPISYIIKIYIYFFGCPFVRLLLISPLTGSKLPAPLFSPLSSLFFFFFFDEKGKKKT